MTDETSAPGLDSAPAPVEITPAATSQEPFSVSEAARALASARKPKEQAQVEQPGQADPVEPQESAQADAAPPEVEAPSEAPTDAEPAEQPSIEPPRSWTKEAKERWQSLPRETQEYLAHREQERDREVRRSQNETADIRKAAEAERTQAEQARKQYEAQLPALMQALQDSQAGAFADIRTVDDVARLATEDPFRYIQWQAHQTKLQAVNAEIQRVEGEKSAAHQTEWAKHVQRENELFAEYAPEFADKAKAQELTAKAVEQLHELGFKDEELNDLAAGKQKLSIYDHRIQRLLFNAIKFSEIKSAPAKAIPKPVPQVQRPGVAPPKGAAAAADIQALSTKLDRTGNPRDALALLQARRKAS